MKLLIIYTHPNHESLCYSFLQKILQGSNENSNVKDIKVLDLYEEKFNPLLVFNRDKPRRNLYCDAELEKYRQQIIWADKLVFIYPIWWGRPPAMLLGYIDQIFASNFAYRYKGFTSEGLLEGRSAVCISTMRGPTNYPLFFLHDAHKVLMKKALFNYVGIKKVKFFEFGNMESENGKQVEKLNKIYNYFKNIGL
ncbi:NAD(P)H dehydrogenase [Clostridium pasteurianum DSM 525 = ATCC 6013]|uniref:NAD(P)H dehydrogenase n=1 Tax=Clostridium pasteurianum DSM 525 = ATCC 6013 TaxID=1262449 RepID=A0A0H3J9E0_CLOPA|nr:NAD(P)H-dependent oxidoreductase [Clostridium pasteurianum]AJA49947.1 NAD(P)H dehydrogenase [Clostridium pasteurianum DSM 525 = ATCC 6013]AJA53935.1 NAD(P)H dehydrogenase [Clostridium pasteurianum DSM 525 = ATCC 6013]AOZ77081.1 NAD(P)H dehydrogenase [Clostridium pasteurianum DSM 525 = ATCC 6013]AOZ80878.1 NAD(P)H dehydrogenase [Clostridium pasteurianum]ELP59341.1 NAD(P)H dehydrogenase (quinone) [Clostridium pasteurianum DSM 525 = ATCC 6013]